MITTWPEYLRGHFWLLSPTGCLIWSRARQSGYGVLWPRKSVTKRYGVSRKVYAHHLAWILHNGPIPGDLEIDHLCETPLCVNHEHMELVTHAENMRRAHAARLARMGGKCGNGHEGKVLGQACAACNAANQRRFQARQKAQRIGALPLRDFTGARTLQ